MRGWVFFVGFLCLASPAVAARQQVGQFYGWGAFSERAAGRCFAASEPAGRQGSGGAAFVTFWPDAGNRARPSFRLRSPPRAGSAILLLIGGRSFPLKSIGGREVIPADPRVEGAILAAMRSEPRLTIVTRTARGGRIRDDYALTGFSSAVDAAALACARP
ncbi:hypothetical protein [Allosphingosinicella vermicomposti]|uniref:hypothetical protein n=1 Tax=Allosphingosinicella vermicomposti TaxID=614671 RepID=UPI00131A5817|nr:hypothetical protein [Allosphingosinicella vermicomposti]